MLSCQDDAVFLAP